MKLQVLSTLVVLWISVMPLPGSVFGSEGEAPDRTVYDKLPVKEVTIFKDGHAYVLHEGL
jgi:hypothetical protein